ncbi:hypothetical protein Tco_1060217, partial [Tanacetum coccineum]
IQQPVELASVSSEYALSNSTSRSHIRWESTTGGDSLHRQPRCSGPPLDYKHIKSCTYSYEHCGALLWYEERIRHSLRNAGPRDNHCCMGGRVALRTYQVYPKYMKLFLEDRHFLENIRAYNQMFSMTSLAEGEPPRFLQLYIYDTDNEVNNCMNHFGGDNSSFRRDIAEGLIDLLDIHNQG